MPNKVEMDSNPYSVAPLGAASVAAQRHPAEQEEM